MSNCNFTYSTALEFLDMNNEYIYAVHINFIYLHLTLTWKRERQTYDKTIPYFLKYPAPSNKLHTPFLRSKNLKFFKNMNFMNNLSFFWNISAHNKQFLNLNALFFIFPPHLQPLLSRFWCPATRKWYVLTSWLCYCIIFKLYFVKSKLYAIRLKITYRYSSLLLSSSSLSTELEWSGSLSHRQSP
jgi:hypothetical protein